MAFSLSKLLCNPFSRMSGNVFCLSKPNSVLAGLFLLCALGWVINRVTGLNFRTIKPFSGMGNKTMQLFLQCFSAPQKPASETPLSTTTQAATPSENREIASIPVNTSNEQLLKMMIFLPDNDGKLALDYENQQNKMINDLLGERIRQGFAQHANEGEDLVAQALTPLFNLAKSDPDRFMVLVNSVIWNSRHCPRFTATVLEKIEWPSETLKQERLPGCLASYIVHKCLELQDYSIEIGSSSSDKKSIYFCTSKLLVITKRILGHGDFVKEPESLSPFLVQGIGMALQDYAKAAMEMLKEQYDEGQTDERTNIGLNLVIGQFHECRFPCSMVAPVLPYLKKIPGLVGLEINDVGGSGLVTAKRNRQRGHAFRDEDAPALLEIFRTNPYLFHVKININGMTLEKETQFVQEWQEIMTNRLKPAIKDLLALEAPKEHKADSDNE
jgi:hypothetical protein